MQINSNYIFGDFWRHLGTKVKEMLVYYIWRIKVSGCNPKPTYSKKLDITFF